MCEKNKLALHMLSKNYLRDAVFMEAWLENGGLKALVQAMLHTTGSTQALTLRCLVSTMERSATLPGAKGKLKSGEITPAVFAVILELCNTDTIATQKSALQLASLLVSEEAGNVLTFDQVQMAASLAATEITRSLPDEVRSSQAASGGLYLWNVLTNKGLLSNDLDCAMYALETLNGVIVMSGNPESFLTQLDEECGLLRIIHERCLQRREALEKQLVAQQRARLCHIERDRVRDEL